MVTAMLRRQPTWVDVVGFQIEKVHTGVLATLLEDPRTAPPVLHSLLALGRFKASTVKDSVERESHASGGASRTRADLVAIAEFRNGSKREVAIETKVDSNCDYIQLTRTASPEVSCLLLAVGVTGLQWRGRELPGGWRLIDAGRWLATLDSVGRLPDVLAVYRDAVAAEVEMQEMAFLDANGELGAAESWRPGRGQLPRWQRLRDWAWLAEVRSYLDHGEKHGGRDEPRSGPVMYFETSKRSLANGVQVYADLMIDGGVRKLVIKGDGGIPDQRARTWEALGRDLAEVDLTPALRKPRRTSQGSFRIATYAFDVDHAHPRSAGKKCNEVLGFVSNWAD